MKDGRRWVEGDFSKKVKGEGGSLFLFLFLSSSSWEGLLSEGCTRRFLFFLPAVSHSFFFFYCSFLSFFLSGLFLITSLFHVFLFPFLFPFFSLLRSSLQRVCLGGGLETSKPRGVGSCGEGTKEEQEQQRTGREKNDQANQVKAEPTTCGGGDDNDTTGGSGSGRQRKAERQDKKERHLTAGRQLAFL